MSDFCINGTPIAKLRVVDLKNELEARGLSKSGKKDELVVRLLSYMEAQPPGEVGDMAEQVDPDGEVEGEACDVNGASKEESEREIREREKKAQEAEIQRMMEETQRKAEIQRKEAEERLAREAREKTEMKESLEQEEKSKKQEEERLRKEAAEKEQKIADRRKIDEEKAEEVKKLEEKRERDLRKEKEETVKREKEELERKREKEEIDRKNEKEETLRREKEQEEKETRHEKEEKAKKEAEKQKETDQSVAKSPESTKTEEAAEGGDDTLVMEIDQADNIVEEESKTKEVEAEEALMSAEPGEVKSLRKLGGAGRTAGEVGRKRGWGASKPAADTTSVSISSESLRDVVPDPAPLLDTADPDTVDYEPDADLVGPKVPESAKKDEPEKKKKKIVVTDLNETAVILIVNLTRPFTVNQLKEMLKRTGTIEEFWIDRIKSTCCVQFSSVDQASETRMALDGVTWPQGNPKTLRVTFSTEENLKKYQESNGEAALVGGKAAGENGQGGRGAREWDKNKVDQEEERAREREKRLAREQERREEGSRRTVVEERDQKPVRSLEDLFKKTAAAPAIYWKPLSEKDIARKMEEKSKKTMEAKIRREMEDTKQSLQRSKDLLPARRRSDGSSGNCSD